MKTSRIKAYYQDYMRAVNKYGYRSIYDCYKNPSINKFKAELSILDECIHNIVLLAITQICLLAVICLTEMANCGLQFIRLVIMEK